MTKRFFSYFWASILSASLISVVPGSSLAQGKFETEQLFRKGSWVVELTHNTQTGNLWCDASTTNRRGQNFSLTAYGDGQFTIFIFDDSWSIDERPLRFIIDIDYSRWNIGGHGRENFVAITPTDHKDAVRFVGELMGGNAVAVLNQNEVRLAVFSLNGSYAAVTSLMDCWNAITNRDPFDSSDPFQGASDPF